MKWESNPKKKNGLRDTWITVWELRNWYSPKSEAQWVWIPFPLVFTAYLTEHTQKILLLCSHKTLKSIWWFECVTDWLTDSRTNICIWHIWGEQLFLTMFRQGKTRLYWNNALTSFVYKHKHVGHISRQKYKQTWRKMASLYPRSGAILFLNSVMTMSQDLGGSLLNNFLENPVPLLPNILLKECHWKHQSTVVNQMFKKKQKSKN